MIRDRSDRERDVPANETDEAWQGEIQVGPGGPQPLWMRLLVPFLYLFAIVYMLVYAGDKPVILVFAGALAIRVGYILYRSFRREENITGSGLKE